ncbi:hypothetical protein ANCDUO_13793, partial [Ancylostoma duodenale]
VVGYRDDPDLQVLIDTMQESWHCCGINGADDWDRNTYFSIAAREAKLLSAVDVVDLLRLLFYCYGNPFRYHRLKQAVCRSHAF